MTDPTECEKLGLALRSHEPPESMCESLQRKQFKYRTICPARWLRLLPSRPNNANKSARTPGRGRTTRTREHRHCALVDLAAGGDGVVDKHDADVVFASICRKDHAFGQFACQLRGGKVGNKDCLFADQVFGGIPFCNARQNLTGACAVFNLELEQLAGFFQLFTADLPTRRSIFPKSSILISGRKATPSAFSSSAGAADVAASFAASAAAAAICGSTISF